MSLEVKDITVTYGERVILEKVSFQIDEGKIIGLVAPNGTGKTTLFNAIMRFIPVRSGEILIDGKEYTAKNADVRALHKQITFFPDQADLYENFSGTEHIQMYADVWKRDQSQVDEIIDRLQMRHYVDRKVKEYSLGMRQRLCFAMMVAADTPIMFMDEVMNGLDPENVSLVSDILIDLREQGKIIMVASHLLDNLDEYADQVFFLKDRVLYQINDHHQKQSEYYKVMCTKEQAQHLEEKISLPNETIHLGNSLLCIPIESLGETEELQLFKAVRQLENVTLSIGPLGTSEHYSHIYGLELHSFDRGHSYEAAEK